MRRKFLVIPILALLITAMISGCSGSGTNINTDDPEKAFNIAKRKYDRGDYVDAIEDFSFIKVKFAGTAVSDKTQFYLGESYFGQKEYINAAYELEVLLKNYPLSPLVPDAKYRLGCTYYMLSPKSALDQEFTYYAITEFQQYLELFPTHKNTADAEKKLTELKNKLAYKDFYTAEIYVKMDDYRAAAMYYNNVYEKFIDSDFADDAMVGHADVLITMKKFDEARKVLEKFNKLFPNSNLKNRANNLLRSIG